MCLVTSRKWILIDHESGLPTRILQKGGWWCATGKGNSWVGSGLSLHCQHLHHHSLNKVWFSNYGPGNSQGPNNPTLSQQSHCEKRCNTLNKCNFCNLSWTFMQPFIHEWSHPLFRQAAEINFSCHTWLISLQLFVVWRAKPYLWCFYMWSESRYLKQASSHATRHQIIYIHALIKASFIFNRIVMRQTRKWVGQSIVSFKTI